MARRLHQFSYSHFNEKARWPLAFKGLDVERVNYLPGPHAASIRKLSGQTQTPVLEWDGEVVPGSAAIIEFLEKVMPERPLYPADPVMQQKALALAAWFDAELGPKGRRALFCATIEDGRYLATLFAGDRSWPARTAYAVMQPLVRPIMRRSMDITPAAEGEALRAVEEALDFVARESLATGYLVGDRFSVADLTGAALLALTANPDHVDMKRPEPKPASVSPWLSKWADHPGVAWVRRIYAEHRP